MSRMEEQPGLFCMGTVEPGKQVFEITFDGNAEYILEGIHVYVMSLEKQEQFRREREDGSLENIVVSEDRITANIGVDKREVLFLSVPYNAGWKAWVDGEEAEIWKADYGFSALILEPGEHEICLKYSTPGILAGAVCTVVMAVILVGWCMWNHKQKKQEKH